MIEIREATKNQAAEIASLIMTAMTDDCCLYFCGEGDGLEDLASGRACSHSAEQASLRRSRLLAAFRMMMTMLVEREDSQYSYRNTLVAMDADRVVGISVSYDGGLLHLLLATKERANRLGLPCVGLLVDKDNPVGEALYASVGFQYVNDNQWGGHPMKHLTL